MKTITIDFARILFWLFMLFLVWIGKVPAWAAVALACYSAKAEFTFERKW